MPRFETPAIVVTPEEFVEACLPRDVDKLIEILKEDYQDELEKEIHPSPEDFLEKCHHGELEVTYNLLQDQYGIGKDEDERSESQRQFNYHLSCLRYGWLAITKEDAEIIAILAKKYGAL